MLILSKVINEQTKQVELGYEEYKAFYISNDYTYQEVEQSYNKFWYLKGFAPQQSIEEQNENVRATREQLFASSPCSDYKYAYEENVARHGQDSEQAKGAASIWLAEKDKIRSENPYLQDSFA